MLVLSRQRDETIMIGDDIAITVVDIRGDKVRLGITAPTKIAVHRKEVYEAIKAENQRAAAIQTDAEDLAALRSASASPGRPIPIRPGISGGKTSRLAITGGNLSISGGSPSGHGGANGHASPPPPAAFVRTTGTAPTHPPRSAHGST